MKSFYRILLDVLESCISSLVILFLSLAYVGFGHLTFSSKLYPVIQLVKLN